MVQAATLEGPFCVHTYEVRVERSANTVSLRSAAGQNPTLTSWPEAIALCRDAGFHLCTSEEWEDACDGTPGFGGREYATPDGSYTPGDCAVSDYRLAIHPPLGLTAAFPHCHTPSGIYDLLGNVWEWTDPQTTDAEGQPLSDKRGAGHYSGSPANCHFQAIGLHPLDFRGTIGFRCCAPPAGSGTLPARGG